MPHCNAHRLRGHKDVGVHLLSFVQSHNQHLTSGIFSARPNVCYCTWKWTDRRKNGKKTLSDWELSIFPTTQHSSGTITEVGVFRPTAKDRPGVKVADWQGGKVAGGYITLSSVCVMMLKGCLPLLLTRIIIANEWNSAAHIKRHVVEPYHNARSHVCFDVYSVRKDLVNLTRADYFCRM